jgi:hypothetical protein
MRSGDPSPIRLLAVDNHQLIRVGVATPLLRESDIEAGAGIVLRP